jgi:hypothetical protein
MLEHTLSQNHQALQALGQAAGQVRAYSEGLAGQQRKVEEGHQLQMRLATLTEQSVSKLVDASRQQEVMLGQYRSTFEKYQGVFQGLDQELDRTLSTILTKMDQYNRNAERNFEALLKTANQYFPDIASTLKDANGDLREQLEELTDTLATGVAKLKTA